MKKRQTGFSLVELMIVVAIIGILAAVAVPAYTNYTTRSKVASSIALATSAKTAVSEFWNSNGTWPANNAAVNLAAAANINNDYVTSVTVANNVITIQFRAQGGPVPQALNNGTITLTANAANAGVLTWTCASNNIQATFQPQGCTFNGA